MDIYLLGTPVSRLLIEISCGDIELPGVKVKVPQDRYDSLILRVEEFHRGKHENHDAVNRFLSRRCDRAFLVKFLNRNPTFIQSLQVSSYFSYVSDVDVINRLDEFALLPEAERLRRVAAVRDLAVSTPDAGFLDGRIISFLRPDEVEELLEHVRTNLIGDLDSCIDNWRGNFDGGQDPEEFFSELKAALEDYKRALGANPQAVSWIEDGLARIDDLVEELRSESPEEPDSDYRYQTQGLPADSGGSRSIFDDVDQ
jgi:hypothetical protein